MFVDVNTYVGHWPFRNLRNSTLEDLDKLAQKYEVTHMVVANLNGLFYKDTNVANEELLQWLKAYKGKTEFIPLAMVNPKYPMWEKDARAMIAAGFKGFEIAPLYHDYKLGPQFKYDSYEMEVVAGPVMELAKELDVPVRICAGFENDRGRSHMDVQKNITGDDFYALCSRYPDTRVLCTDIMPLAIGETFMNYVKEHKNVYFDTWCIGDDMVYRLHEPTLQFLSMDQICYGSLSPFVYMEQSQVNLEYSSCLDIGAVKTNGAALFKL